MLSTAYYITAVLIATLGASVAAIPLYRVFCSATGFAGTTQHKEDTNLSDIDPIRRRPIRVSFNADTEASMQWNFKPQQEVISVVPGESALAFFTAYNPTEEPIVGVSTYNVIPYEAGQYFNKIQCFCFEDQRLNPHEQVDMPVFFYIDPEFATDPYMDHISEITLSYCFFKSSNFNSLNTTVVDQPPQSLPNP